MVRVIGAEQFVAFGFIICAAQRAVGQAQLATGVGVQRGSRQETVLEQLGAQQRQRMAPQLATVPASRMSDS